MCIPNYQVKKVKVVKLGIGFKVCTLVTYVSNLCKQLLQCTCSCLERDMNTVFSLNFYLHSLYPLCYMQHAVHVLGKYSMASRMWKHCELGAWICTCIHVIIIRLLVDSFLWLLPLQAINFYSKTKSIPQISQLYAVAKADEAFRFLVCLFYQLFTQLKHSMLVPLLHAVFRPFCCVL